MDPVLAVVVRGALALLLVVAALHKLRGREEFRATLDAYAVLPVPLVAPLAAVVPLLELSAAALLVAPATAAAGGVLMAALLAIYALAMGVNLLRGRRDLECGCMGPVARSPISAGLLVRNAVLIVAALVAGFAPLHARPLVWVDFVTVPLAMATLAALYAAAERLLALAPSVGSLRTRTRASSVDPHADADVAEAPAS